MIDSNNIGAGVFSNIVNMHLSPREVIFDFGVALPPSPASDGSVVLVSRVFLTIEHAKEFKTVLEETLKRSESI
jgi:hypothetical protein